MKRIKAVMAVCLAAVITAAFTSCNENSTSPSSDSSSSASSSGSAGSAAASGKAASTPEECLKMSCDLMKNASGAEMLDCIPDSFLNGLFEEYDTDRTKVEEYLTEKLRSQTYSDDEGNKYSYTDIEDYGYEITLSGDFSKDNIKDVLKRIKALDLDEYGFEPDNIEEISRITYDNNISFKNGKTFSKKGLVATFIKYEGSWYALTAMTGLEKEMQKM